MKKLTTIMLLAAGAFGFVAAESIGTATAFAAEEKKKAPAPETVKARELKALYDYYASGKAGNRMRRWAQYLSEQKGGILALVPKLDIIAKEDAAAAHHIAWVYDELLDKGEEPVEGVNTRKVIEKYDFNRWIKKYATEDELAKVSPAKTKQYLGTFKDAANRLGEDSVWTKAQERAKKADKE
ncbi:MAG: hypothetical protein LBT53_05970 [Puniceicoccales bacterium]|jgi:hypothetical protein|nr:hypothetical protein [Puniceicoccales bacterium]